MGSSSSSSSSIDMVAMTSIWVKPMDEKQQQKQQADLEQGSKEQLSAGAHIVPESRRIWLMVELLWAFLPVF